MTEPIDPITFEVISNALSTTADEMALTIMRSAYSQVVRDSMDYSTALCDRNGAGDRAGSDAGGAARRVSRRDATPDRSSSATTMQPGDVFIFNDPYGAGRPASAGHLRHQADLPWTAAWRATPPRWRIIATSAA